jgi:hypothetical protein
MAAEHISDMSMGELRAFVESIIEEHMGPPRSLSYRQQGKRSIEEVLTSMRANLWTPPAGAKSSLEMLREDRDR